MVEVVEAYKIKISRVLPFEGQPRRWFNLLELEELANSIQDNGQVQPIKVCRNDEQPGTFLIIDGERRWRAHKLIQERTGKEPTIDAFVDLVKNVKDHFRKSVIANLHRKDISPLDEAAALAKLYEDGEPVEELARMLGKTMAYVYGYLKMHTLPDEVKELMDENRPRNVRLTTTAAIEIARSTRDQELRTELAKETITRELGLAESRDLINRRTGGTNVNWAKDDRSWNRRRQTGLRNYRRLSMFLARTRSYLSELLKNTDFEGMYASREDETGDRRYDAKIIQSNLDYLNDLKKKLSTIEGDNLYRDFDVVQIDELVKQFEGLLQHTKD